MADLAQLAHPGVRVRGLTHDEIAEVIAVDHIGDKMLQITYRAGSVVGERLVSADDAASMEIVTEGEQWTFDGDPSAFKLSAEARRIRLAHLFDPLLAVNGSLVEPYPHQIAAVYEEMLERQPLRYLLADDPGAGKTIMAGLLIKELIARGDLQRCLIVAPGSLAEQWQDELWEKFRLEFEIINASKVESDPDANPFLRTHFAVVSLDRLKREELREKVIKKPWDLVIVDEAHKMSARYFGNEIKKSQRYELGEALADPNVSRHFLLMTATPHNGKPEDFQAFMRLLDPDRFHGKFRSGEHGDNGNDMMRRLVKEQMVTFDGRRLFPERQANTVPFPLSDAEAQLYTAVTEYVRDVMGRADEIAAGGDKKRGNFIGFALALLQRRLASSPEAIYKSLMRRRQRLETELGEAKLAEQGGYVALKPVKISNVFTDDDMLLDLEGDVEDIEELERAAEEEGHAGRDVASLEWELAQVRRIEQIAEQVRGSGTDSKWVALQGLLDSDAMLDDNGDRRKLIVFTEHKDTLDYLTDKIQRLFGSREAVVTISGSTKRELRREIQQQFRQNKDVKVLVATDAAGEGINLQNANLMVNYDLPWNPNRLEQRFGRIHRIGQTEVCFMWNLIAQDTREGEVFQRLFDKLEEERIALGHDGVFDVLGEMFEQQDLRELLLEAIRYGKDPEVRNRIFEIVDGATDPEHLNKLLRERAIGQDEFNEAKLAHVREQMERAAAARMQPHFIKAFFVAAFEHLGGKFHERKFDRLEITHVPAEIRHAAARLGRTRLLDRYERICFDKERVNVKDEKFADFVCPGHPLLDATVEAILFKHRHLLVGGAVLVDPNDDGEIPTAMCLLEHSITDARQTTEGESRTISRRMQFVALDDEGGAWDAGPAPYLDYEVVAPEIRAKLLEETRGDWLGDGLERDAKTYASKEIAVPHFDEVKERQIPRIEQTKKLVRERLSREINHYDELAAIAQQKIDAGKREGRMNRAVAERIADELRARLTEREEELARQKQISNMPPQVTGRALIIPAGLVRKVVGDEAATELTVDDHSVDPAARAHIEEVAMGAVAELETSLKRFPKDVSADKVGWDIEAWDRVSNASPRFIEVKGRALGADTITVTRNEILAGLNKGDEFILAIVIVDGDDAAELIYVPDPFSGIGIDTRFEAVSAVLKIERMRAKAIDPATLAPDTATPAGSIA